MEKSHGKLKTMKDYLKFINYLYIVKNPINKLKIQMKHISDKLKWINNPQKKETFHFGWLIKAPT